MKILIVMGGFYPGKKYGGPPVSIDNFCALMEEIQCYVVTKNHDMGECEPYKNIEKGWNDRGNCKVLYLEEDHYNIRSFEKVIESIRPNILYLQGVFQKCIIPCLKLAQKYNIKVLLAPRGELCAGAMKKKYKKVPYICLLKILRLLQGVHFQSTSDEETEAIEKYLNVKKTRIHYLSNVPSIPKRKFENNKKFSGAAKFIFMSRIVRKKNLLYAINCFQNAVGNVKLDIYGPIEDEQYWNECMLAIKSLPNNIKVEYKGLLEHGEVHETFSKYHAFIFPTFSENYGHVIVEAMLSKCPVIISDQTPWNDISIENVGFVFSLDEIEKFKQTIQRIIDYDEENYISLLNNLERYTNLKLKVKELKCTYEEALHKIVAS